ncbi:MAG TPA: S1 RNA-binding domain-containing protein, partial [Pyrinomonadaceae bacterium]
MSTEEPKPSDGEDNNNSTQTGAPEASPQIIEPQPQQQGASAAAAKASTPAPAQAEASAADDDDDESRSGSDMDFGAMLDQFEQEQAGFQEGEVVRGKVVGISERGVVIDFGYKSEGIVNQAEFTENGVLTVSPGDEVDVLVKSMET